MKRKIYPNKTDALGFNTVIDYSRLIEIQSNIVSKERVKVKKMTKSNMHRMGKKVSSYD